MKTRPFQTTRALEDGHKARIADAHMDRWSRHHIDPKDGVGVLWVLVENWALSSECFDAELDLTRMLSPSFYVVPHNT